MLKPVKGFEGLYEVSDAGYVQTVEHTITDKAGHQYTIKSRVLKPSKIGRGYLAVYLRKEGKTYVQYVHRLVAEAFVPNPDNKPIVNHKNGNKLKCEASNLQWSTYSENNQHAYDTGLKPKGEGQYKARLTENQVREIKQNGKYTTYENIARKYGVSKATIRDVLLCRTWKTVC